MITKTIKILQSDFDKAVTRPWSPKTCLIAQAGKRLGIPRLERECRGELESLQISFDLSYATSAKVKDWDQLINIRESLPMELDLDVAKKNEWGIL